MTITIGDGKITPKIKVKAPTNARIVESAVGTALKIHRIGEAGCLILKRIVTLINKLMHPIIRIIMCTRLFM